MIEPGQRIYISAGRTFKTSNNSRSTALLRTFPEMLMISSSMLGCAPAKDSRRRLTPLSLVDLVLKGASGAFFTFSGRVGYDNLPNRPETGTVDRLVPILYRPRCCVVNFGQVTQASLLTTCHKLRRFVPACKKIKPLKVVVF